VYYDRQDRIGGEGKLSFVSRIKYAMDAITSFSYKPLRFSFVAAMGFLLTACSGLSHLHRIPTRWNSLIRGRFTDGKPASFLHRDSWRVSRARL